MLKDMGVIPLTLLDLISVWFLQGEPAHFEYVLYPLHSASITGLATCIRKPLIATCSLDRSVRIWNYESK